MSKLLEGCESWDQILDLLRTDEEELLQGGGAEAIQRQHQKNRLTARERIQKLIDPGSQFFELGLFRAFEMYQEWGRVPAAGIEPPGSTEYGPSAQCSGSNQ